MYPESVQQLERGQRRQALIFLIVGILVLVGVVAAFVGLPFGDDKVIYYLEFTESVVNLDVGTPVRYKGVRFGSISDIGVDPRAPDKVRVTLALDPGAPITESTSARIASATFLGPYYIELTGTRADSKPMPAGSTLPADQSALAKILASSESMMSSLNKLLTDLNKLFTDENIANIHAAIAGFNDSMESLRSVSERLGNDISGAFSAMQKLMEDTNGLVQRNEQQIQRVIANLDSVLEKTESFLARGELDKLSTDAQALMTRLNNESAETAKAMRTWLEQNQLADLKSGLLTEVGAVRQSLDALTKSLSSEVVRANRGGVEPLTQDLRAAVQSLDALLKMLERNPRALIFGGSPAEIRVPEPVK
jgi:phospholipid/cholesterol/gamma-HCH transport system substrate-binding protein